MRTEDLFKYGVTPKEGENAGKRFIVDRITKKEVFCYCAEDPRAIKGFAHGSYDLWQPEKTLFEDNSIAPTWGNLKKAAEKAGISDDMEFVVPCGPFSGYCEPVSFSIETIREVYGKPKQYIVVR